MHPYYEQPDFMALANIAHQDRPDVEAPTTGPTFGFGEEPVSILGEPIYDPVTFELLGSFVRMPGPALGPDPGIWFVGADGQRRPAPTGDVLLRSLGGFIFARVSDQGDLSQQRRPSQTELQRLGLVPTTAGGSGGRSIAEEIQLLEVQAAIARREGDHAREADFRNQIEALKLSQEFQAGENVLSRENQVVIQRLSDLSSLQRQILSDKARGREIMVEMIGNDPIRAGALAQGGVPRRGTPADQFRGELQQTIDQPLIQPTSTTLPDINAAIEETQGNLGLPTAPSFTNPIASAAHGGIIDMKKSKNGQFRVLVGEQGPELLEGNKEGIQITPIASAAHGGRISFSESPFATFDVPGFGAGPTRAPRAASQLRAPTTRGPTLSAPSDSVRGAPTAFGGSGVDTFQDILEGVRDLLPPSGSPPVAPPPAVAPPISTIQDTEFVRPGGELTQGFESVFDFLGFDRVPTFTEGPFGGMQLPPGRQAETFAALGIDPALFRTIDESGQGNAFFRTPAGELQQFSPGGQFQQSLAFGAGAGFAPQDFVTVGADQFGDTSGATPFEEQGLFSSSDPFPSPRAPLSIPSEVTGGAGVLLPDPRVIASLWPRLPAAVKQNLLSAYGVAGLGRESVGDILSFFTPGGSFSGRPAGFG